VRSRACIALGFPHTGSITERARQPLQVDKQCSANFFLKWGWHQLTDQLTGYTFSFSPPGRVTGWICEPARRYPFYMVHPFNSDPVYTAILKAQWLAEWAYYNGSGFYAGDDGR